MKKVDLGCGISKKEGFLGVDCLELAGVDIFHDLNVFPYPFPDDDVDEVWMDNVLEHLSEPLTAMEEVHRISKPGAKIKISVPYFRSRYAIIDPTHKNFFGVSWFDYFDPTSALHRQYKYTRATFRVDHIEFDREWKPRHLGKLQRFVVKLAERYPAFYEAKLSHLLPLSSLTYYLTVIK